MMRAFRSWHRSLLGCLLLLFSVCCSGLPTPPIEVPFSVADKDAVAEFDIRIAEKSHYTFGLSFLVNEKVPGDAQRLIALMGTWGGEKAKGHDAGAPLKVRLLLKKTDASVVFDQEVSEIYWYSHGSGRYDKRIVDVVLEPGVYKVRLENRLKSAAMDGHASQFHIYKTYLGK